MNIWIYSQLTDILLDEPYWANEQYGKHIENKFL